VLLVNLLAALNFANVFLKIKNVWKIKKRKFFTSMAAVWLRATQTDISAAHCGGRAALLLLRASFGSYS